MKIILDYTRWRDRKNLGYRYKKTYWFFRYGKGTAYEPSYYITIIGFGVCIIFSRD